MGWRFFARLGAETSKPRRVLRLGFEVLAVWGARVSSGGGVGGEVNLPPLGGSNTPTKGRRIGAYSLTLRVVAVDPSCPWPCRMASVFLLARPIGHVLIRSPTPPPHPPHPPPRRLRRRVPLRATLERLRRSMAALRAALFKNTWNLGFWA